MSYYVLRYRIGSINDPLTTLVKAQGATEAWKTLLAHRPKDPNIHPVETIPCGERIVEAGDA